MNFAINPWVAIGVLASTAATDAAYVFFNAAVSSRRRVWAANWSSIWYMAGGIRVGDLASSRRTPDPAAPRSAVTLLPRDLTPFPAA
jgi:hypothetical protein